MDPVVIITIIFIMLALITTLVTVYIESRKYTKRLEERIERLSSRIQAMNMKELDTVLKSIEYRKERDELYKLIEDMHSTSEALEDGRQIKIMPKLPRDYLDESNKLKTYKSYYTYNPPQYDTQTDNQSDNSSSYSGGGGDFSGSGSGGSWD